MRRTPLVVVWIVLHVSSIAAAADDQSLMKSAWDVLDAGLHQKSAGKRAQAVSALGLMPGDPKAVAAAENALNDHSATVVRAAITALGDMDSQASSPKIKALIPHSDAKTVFAAAAVLKKFNDPEGYEIYYQVFTGQRKAGGSIIDGLKDPKTDIRYGAEAAIDILPFGGYASGAFDYVVQNGWSHPEARVEAASALADDKDAPAKAALVQCAIKAKKPIQLACLRALAKRGDPSVVEGIKPVIDSGKPSIRYTAAAAVLHLVSLRASKAAS